MTITMTNATTTARVDVHDMRLGAVRALQKALPTVVAGGAAADQLRWHLTGTDAVALRQLFVRLALDSQRWADLLATRVAASGFAGDARSATVAAAIRSYPTMHVDRREAVEVLDRLLRDVAFTAQAAASANVGTDRVSRDVAVSVRAGAEAYLRMLDANGVSCRAEGILHGQTG